MGLEGERYSNKKLKKFEHALLNVVIKMKKKRRKKATGTEV